MARTGERVTYGDLVERSRRGAGLLRALGVGPADHIAILMENHPRLLEVAWAAQRAGVRYTLVSSRSTPAECAYVLDDCAAKLLVTSARCMDVARAAVLDATGTAGLLLVDGAARGFGDYATLAAAQSPSHRADEVEGADFLYSSGTTGRPKGIVMDLPLAPIGTPPGFAHLLQRLWGFGPDTVYLSPAPLYHSAPLRFTMTVQRFGGTSIIMEDFDAMQVLQLVEQHRVTHVQMVPTMFSRLLALPERDRTAADLSSLKAVIHAAAPCPRHVKEQMIAWLGPIVDEFYSATENYMFTYISADDWLAHPGSVGRPLFGVPHVLDDAGQELAPGGIGTLWSEGGREFAYHNDAEKTAGSRNERGWATVGDVGFVDAEGYVHLVDRRTDLIISGGVNIYPREIEDALTSHPAVDDVAVFGVPNDEFGEEVKAVVQPRPMSGAEPELAAQLLDHCRTQLAAYKCPRSFDFRTELPRHPTGKLHKRLLRDEYLDAERRGTP